MAKEITHILVAQDVFGELTDGGQARLARVIEQNMEEFFLGALIPDALFYDVPPFRMNPLKHDWIARDLHREEVTDNDDTAMGFFRAISDTPSAWQEKMAFVAGIVTHTVVDRVFHEAIDHYTAAWGETGTTAMATHREIETLVDTFLLQGLSMGPREFFRQYFSRGDDPGVLRLCHLYIAGLTESSTGLDASLPHVLSRAHRQQRLFLRLFAARPLHRVVKGLDYLAGGRLRAWHSLFYGGPIDVECFPVLRRLGVTSPNPGDTFFREVTRLRETAAQEALKSIQEAVMTHC